MFDNKQIEALKAPLNRSAVKEREQAGRKLSYIEGWHAIDEANRIFGFDGWDREVMAERETSRDLVDVTGKNGAYKQWRVTYTMRVRITVVAGGSEIIREGTGYGSGMAKPEALGDAIESAIKEAETDAMKRALMTFGNPFGLALYDKTQASVVNDAVPEPQSNVTPLRQNDPAVSTAAINMGREFRSCKSFADIDIMKTTPEFLLFWKKANGADRAHVANKVEEAKAALADIMAAG